MTSSTTMRWSRRIASLSLLSAGVVVLLALFWTSRPPAAASATSSSGAGSMRSSPKDAPDPLSQRNSRSPQGATSRRLADDDTLATDRSIRVLVKSAHAGQVLRGLHVLLRRFRSAAGAVTVEQVDALTDSDGTASFGDQRSGYYGVAVLHTEYSHSFAHKGGPTVLSIVLDAVPKVQFDLHVVTQAGQPVLGAAVFVQGIEAEGSRLVGKSDSSGRVAVVLQSSGGWIWAAHPQQGASHLVPVGAGEEPLTLVLERDVGSIAILPKTQNRTVEAKVFLRSMSLTTDTISYSGVLPAVVELFRALPAGKYVARVRAEGLGLVRRVIDVLPGQNREYAFELVPAVRVHGVVRSSKHKPLKGIRVRFKDRGQTDGSTIQCLSDAEGRYQLLGLPQGWVSLAVGADTRYVSRQYFVTTSESQELDLLYPDGWEVSGRCVGVDRKGLAGVQVVADRVLLAGRRSSRAARAVTSSSGAFTFKQLAHGIYRLRFYVKTDGSSYSRFPSKTVRVSPDSPCGIVVLKRIGSGLLSCTLDPSVATGYVTVSQKGHPQTGVMLTMVGGVKRSVPLTPGAYVAKLTTGADRRLAWFKPFVIRANQTTDLGEIGIRAPGKLELRCDSSSPDAKPPQRILVTGPGGFRRNLLEDSVSGRVAVGQMPRLVDLSLPPGSYDVHVGGLDWPLSRRSVSIKPGETTRLTLSRGARRRVKVTFLMPDPENSYGMVIELRDAKRNVRLEAMRLKLGQGPLTIKRVLRPGRYVFSVTASGQLDGKFVCVVPRKNANATAPTLDYTFRVRR